MAGKNAFTITMFVMQIILFICYASFTKYSELSEGNILGLGGQQVSEIYREFMDIHVMIFIGFGYLMTFLRSYMYGAVSLNFIIGVFAILWGIITCGFFNQFVGVDDASVSAIPLDVESLYIGDFSAAAALITFGAVLGKVSPTQIIIAVFFEMIFFGLNGAYCFNSLGVADIGGTIVIHLFGAFFGLGLSKVVTSKPAFDSPENNSVKYSDMFSMVGTLFLFIYWPSFVGGLATGNARNRAIFHTVLAISGSALSTFFCSEALRGGKLTMVDIQNATLAGGVTIGAIADFVMHPATALFAGIVAGVLSTVGYVYIQNFVANRLKIHDTCGVLNLHGLPAILGAAFSIILAGSADVEGYGGEAELAQVFGEMPKRSAAEQASMQLTALIVTLIFSFVTGMLTGVIVKKIDPVENPELLYNDAMAFSVPENYTMEGEERVYSINEKIAKIEEVFNSMTGTKIELSHAVQGNQVSPV